MSTAKQLVPSLVDAQPLYWDRSYTKNMRPLRDYPTYYRQTDEINYIDGPPQIGQAYTKENAVWRVEILKDSNGDNTNQFEVVNLSNLITTSSEVVGGETVYRYKYEAPEPEFTYTHTDPIDSVSIEFDQSGQRIILFESMGEIFLNWFDPVPSSLVTTNLGPGRTPVVCTNSYNRVGPASTSERLIFYVDGTTNQIVGRKQLDRFDTEYALPSAPGDVTELLQASKNIYGQLVVVGCYEVDAETVDVISFSETDDSGALISGNDVYEEPSVNSSITNLNINEITLFEAGIIIQQKSPDVPSVAINNLTINNLSIESKIVNYSFPNNDLGGSSEITGFNLNTITVESKVVNYEVTPPELGGSSEVDSISVNTLEVYEALVAYSFADNDLAGSSEITDININTLTVS